MQTAAAAHASASHVRTGSTAAAGPTQTAAAAAAVCEQQGLQWCSSFRVLLKQRLVVRA
jgi:hypothetical protein